MLGEPLAYLGFGLQIRGSVDRRWKRRHVGRRPTRIVAQDLLQQPPPATDGRGAIGFRRERKDGCIREDANAPVVERNLRHLPASASRYGYAVVSAETLVEKAIRPRDEIHDAGVLSEHMVQKSERLVLHRVLQARVPGGKTGRIQTRGIKAIELQPLVAEAVAQVRDARIPEHAEHMALEQVRLLQTSLRRIGHEG